MCVEYDPCFKKTRKERERGREGRGREAEERGRKDRRVSRKRGSIGST